MLTLLPNYEECQYAPDVTWLTLSGSCDLDSHGVVFRHEGDGEGEEGTGTKKK